VAAVTPRTIEIVDRELDRAARQPTRGASMSLTAEQRRALAVLARAGLNGSPQTSLMAHGFCISMIAGLVKRGLATLKREKVWAGRRLVDVGKVRITAAGRDALTAEGCFTRVGVAILYARTRP
jgi:hypothetical protein